LFFGLEFGKFVIISNAKLRLKILFKNLKQASIKEKQTKEVFTPAECEAKQSEEKINKIKILIKHGEKREETLVSSFP